MGCTPLISSLCQLLLKPICHKERGRKREGERKKKWWVGGGGHRWRVREGKGGRGGKERYKQRERDVQTKKGDFPEVLDKRICCYEEGQMLRVVLMVEGRRDGLRSPWEEGHIGGRRVVRRSGRVWGAQKEWLMMNLGYSGPVGLPIPISIPILLIHLPLNPLPNHQPSSPHLHAHL